MPSIQEQIIEEIMHQEPSWSLGDIAYFGPANRSISIAGPIDYKSSYPITSQLLELNARSNEPIKLHINTEGGTLSDSFAIYDTIKTIRAPVYAITQGMCASGGLILLLACEKKFSTENTIFFYHQPILSTEGFNSLDSSQEIAKAYELFNNLYDNTIKKETSIKEKDWLNNFKGKTTKYFTANEAKKFGFIDTIIKGKE